MKFDWQRRNRIAERMDREHWILSSCGKERMWEVAVRFSKPIDFKAVKSNSSYQNELASAYKYKEHFQGLSDFVPMTACPVCGKGAVGTAENNEPVLTVWGVNYFQCPDCSHAYSERFPSKQALQSFYECNTMAADYYIKPEEIALRTNEIYGPKADWMIAAYRQKFGRDPRTILDIGAGAGHLLDYCRRQGLDVAGVEYNQVCRDWCRSNFDIDLVAHEDDLPDLEFDIVASFNLIEHYFAPRDLLGLYRKHFHDESLAVFETPKFNSLTLTIQQLFPDNVHSHAVPYTHNHLFTDASLATLLMLEGFQVSHLWYFGQDVYEMLGAIYTAGGDQVRMEMIGQSRITLREGMDSVNKVVLQYFLVVILKHNAIVIVNRSVVFFLKFVQLFVGDIAIGICRIEIKK